MPSRLTERRGRCSAVLPAGAAGRGEHVGGPLLFRGQAQPCTTFRRGAFLRSASLAFFSGVPGRERPRYSFSHFSKRGHEPPESMAVFLTRQGEGAESQRIRTTPRKTCTSGSRRPVHQRHAPHFRSWGKMVFTGMENPYGSRASDSRDTMVMTGHRLLGACGRMTPPAGTGIRPSVTKSP